MEGKKMRQMPAFGEWKYFESTWDAGLIPSHFWEVDNDLFQVSVMPSKSAHRHRPCTPKGKIGDVKQQEVVKGLVRPMAVDEDLYKIPPELLYQERKRKPWMRRLQRTLVSGCLSFNCIRLEP